MGLRLTAVVLLAFGCGAPAPTPTLSPTLAPTLPPAPSPTAAAAVHPPICSDSNLVWDTLRERLLLATCVNQRAAVDHEQLWSWDGGAWTLVSDDGPPPLVVTSTAWDSLRNVLVRYGGLPLTSNDCVPETWEWAGTDWSQVNISTQLYPTACDHMKMAYDAGRGTTVLVGGGQLQELSPETWGWDGSRWTMLSDGGGPQPRAHHGLLYDPRLGRTLAFGGIDNTAIFVDDLWAWGGQSWRLLDLATAGPGARSHFGFAADQQSVVLFGGATGLSTFATLTDETWLLTSRGWSQLNVPGPSPRGSPALAYDPTRGVFVLYGGFDATGEELGDTWEFDGSTWECVDQCDTSTGSLTNS